MVAEFSNFGTSKISVGRVGGFGRNFTLPTFILISNKSKNKLFPEMGRFSEMVGWAQLGGIKNHPGGFDEKSLVTLTQ